MTGSPQAEPVRELTLEHLHSVLEESSAPACLLQRDRILHINPPLRGLLGWDLAESTLRQILGWERGSTDGEALRNWRRPWMEQPRRVTLADRGWVRRDGRWVRRAAGPLAFDIDAAEFTTSDGELLQLTFVEAPHGRGAVADADMLLAAEAGRVGTWRMDVRSGEIECCRRTRAIFGVAGDGPVSYSFFLELLHPDDRERTRAAITRSLEPAGNGQYGCDYRIRRPDRQTRWVAATGQAFFSQRGGERQPTHLTGIVLDITALRQTDASLLQGEKLATAGRLAACIAHEINNPLEAITNLLFLLEETCGRAEERRYVKLAQQQLTQVIDIATRTLRFYRQPCSPTRCSVPEIVDSALALFDGRVRDADIRVDRQFRGETSILGGREELRQVVVNLVHNAMEAMPQTGGRLIARVHAATRWPSGQRGVRLVIADNGHGMSRATVERIFEPFFTMRPGVGAGLGLWLSLGIVQNHGGAIRVKSRNRSGASGTVFSIFLPYDRRR
jgi:signal transduction histidine kinase